MVIANQTLSSRKKKKKNQSPEAEFRFSLEACSKNNDLASALSLFDSALSKNLRLLPHHFNILLYLCSASLHTPATVESGFRIYHHMLASNIPPTEATITAAARLAAAKHDGDLAFRLVKSASLDHNISPRLRTYDPALLEFCRDPETADKAYEVEVHMGASAGLLPEEPQIAALLRVSAGARREDRVYTYLQKLRDAVKCVAGPTAEAVEWWFRSEVAAEAGISEWDVGQVKEAACRNGGGWHGQGWLGKGRWELSRTSVGSDGCCRCCGESLVCIDVDVEQSRKFAESISLLARERETQANFGEFKEWLDNCGEFDAVVDGANVGLYQQNFADGGFSLSQLDAVVKELKRSQNKWPLVVLHNKRLVALTKTPSGRELLEEWRARGALYITPSGSNDDWYWLYASVKRKCLLVTNDEMRDHIFELLGRNFFFKWKERHQVHFTFVKRNLKLQMPPSYSTVIQESERGSWHVPLEGECSAETLRTWLCITRHKALSSEVPDKNVHEEDTGVSATENGNLPQCGGDKTIANSGKRKERSPSPSKVLPL